MRGGDRLVTQAEYARRRGVAASVVCKAVKAGRLELVDGKVDVRTADKQWQERTDADQQARGNGNRKTRGDGYYAAKTAREGYQAKQAQLDYEQRLGELVRRVDVEKAAFQKGRVLRDRFLSLPDRMAPIMAAESDANVCHAKMRAEILSILRELAAGDDGVTRN